MRPSIETAREAVLAQLVALVEADERIETLWPQGSLATGAADVLRALIERLWPTA